MQGGIEGAVWKSVFQDDIGVEKRAGFITLENPLLGLFDNEIMVVCKRITLRKDNG